MSTPVWYYAPLAQEPCPQDTETRRGQSLDRHNPMKRKAQSGGGLESAEVLPAQSEPNPKKAYLGCPSSSDSEAAYPPSSSASSPSSPSPACSSVFGMATGDISDRFLLSDAVLGTGQFGQVREAFDLFTGERLACKTVRKAQGGAPEVAERQALDLRNEVEVMMRLGGHRNLVQLRGVFEDEFQCHLVMDCCEGGELFEEVVRRQRFQEQDAAVLFSEVVKGVSYLHARSVIHGDLKPENMLLKRKLQDGVPLSVEASRGPIIQLADFGLAVKLAPNQTLRGIAGSPFYMAPEILTGEYSLKADIWSLGVILYILLSGSPPFYGDRDEDVFQMILKGNPDLSSGPWMNIPAEAKNLVRFLLQQDPARRPSTDRVLTHPWMVRYLAPQRAPVVVAAPARKSSASSRQVEQVPVRVL